MTVGQMFSGEVLGCTSQGFGVFRYENRAVFVKGAIPGEICTVIIVKITKTVVYGRLEQIITPSSHRIKPVCPYFGHCGGCDYMHMDYEMETECKCKRVIEALRRIGGVEPEPLLISPAQELKGYRNKVQFAVGTAKDGPTSGFYRARSHELIPIAHCPIQFSEAEAVANAVLDWMKTYHISAYDEHMGTGCIRHIYVRKAFGSGEVMVCLIGVMEKCPKEKQLVETLTAAIPAVSTVIYNVNTNPGNTILGGTYHTLYGSGYLEDLLCGLRFRISPASFYQVNHDQTEVLYKKIIEMADLHGTETVLDLYCGTGTITLSVSSCAGTVIGVESVPQAIEDARENACCNHIDNAHFLCADAGKAAQMLARDGITPMVVIVDPPRKGINADVISAITAMMPERLVYVSCNPGTLARDIKLLGDDGYWFARGETVDLFPRSKHIETVVLLRKK